MSALQSFEKISFILRKIVPVRYSQKNVKFYHYTAGYQRSAGPVRCGAFSHFEDNVRTPEKLVSCRPPVHLTPSWRKLSSSPILSGEAQPSDGGEAKLKEILKSNFPSATNIVVEDISGGCGSMYQVFIESADFKGLSTVKQHLMVNNALKKEIKSMHGIRIQTAIPK